MVAGIMALGGSSSIAGAAPASELTTAGSRTIQIAVPADGAASIAHFVLRAVLKKGAKKAKANTPPLPKLKSTKSFPGVAAAASYRRDAKRKNVFHVTVALWNPVGGPASARALASTAGSPPVSLWSPPLAAGGFDFTCDPDSRCFYDHEKARWFLADVAPLNEPEQPWIVTLCNPPGTTGYHFIPGLGLSPGGVSARDLVATLCLAGGDVTIPQSSWPQFDAAGITFIGYDAEPLPGTNEFVLTVDVIDFANADALGITLADGNQFTGVKSPAGYNCGPNASYTALGCGQTGKLLPDGPFTMNVRLRNLPGRGALRVRAAGQTAYDPRTFPLYLPIVTKS